MMKLNKIDLMWKSSKIHCADLKKSTVTKGIAFCDYSSEWNDLSRDLLFNPDHFIRAMKRIDKDVCPRCKDCPEVQLALLAYYDEL
jgi:hypothetical protein